MVQAVFFDIDGTLIPFGHDTFIDSTKNALKQLKNKGIKIIISSGRPWDMVSQLDELCVPFDGYILLNGQLCLDQGNVIRGISIPSDRLKKAYQYFRDHDIEAIFASRYDTCYVLDRPYFEAQEFNFQPYDPSRMNDDPVYQIMARIHTNEKEIHQGLMDILVDYKGVRWHDESEDIIHKDSGKSVGILEMLKYYNIDIKDTMAFGDGGNDIDMLELVNIGVAMGNARDEIKQHADYVCERDIEDGIYKTLVKYHVIEDELNLCQKK